MSLLHYPEREVLYMTPKKFYLMLDAYKAANRIRDKREEEAQQFL